MDKVVFQHGDVNFKVAKSLPQGVSPIKAENGFVIERGEGVHTHTIIEGDVDVYNDNGVMYLHVKTPMKIDHEEHKTHTLQPGIYIKEIENEYDVESDEAVKTRD
jgi:hypothetical protein